MYYIRGTLSNTLLVVSNSILKIHYEVYYHTCFYGCEIWDLDTLSNLFRDICISELLRDRERERGGKIDNEQYRERQRDKMKHRKRQRKQRDRARGRKNLNWYLSGFFEIYDKYEFIYFFKSIVT